MTKVNKKNKAKNKTFEFLTIFSMIFGIVVGSGVFLKNSKESGGVLGRADGNPILAIIIWVFIGLMCTVMMLTFIEAASSTRDSKHSTMSSWANKFIGRRAGSFYTIFYVTMYSPVLTTIGALFSIKILFQGITWFRGDQSPLMSVETEVAVKILISTIILIGFQFLNSYTQTPSKFIQTIFTFVKFIPFLVVIIGGFILFANGNVGVEGVEETQGNSFEGQKLWSTNSIFLTTIPVLFAFDGFIFGATLQKDCEHKEVVAPAMLSGIVGVTIFYVIVALALFMGGKDGNIFTLLETIFKKDNVKWAGLLFYIVIALTLLTIVNGYTSLTPKFVQSAYEEKFLFNKNFGSEISYKKSALIGSVVTFIVYAIFVGTALMINKEKMIEVGSELKPNPDYLDYFYVVNLFSDSNTVLVFLLYYVLMIGVLKNRKTNKVEVVKVKGAYVAGIITLVILLSITAYIYYDFFIQNIIKTVNADPTGENYIADKKAFISPVVFVGLMLIIGVLFYINEYRISTHNLEEYDFALKLNPKNWSKNYDKAKAIEAFNLKKQKKLENKKSK